MRYILIILVFLSVGANAQMVIKAHANYRPYAQPAVNLLLDDYPNAAAAYSLRKLDKDYTGPLIRVRKDTTGQPEMDIYGDYYGNLDTVGLKNFLLTRSGFVTTWYSQGDSTNVNFSQSTQANQPRIALNGVIDRRNNIPSLYFDGNRFMSVSSSGSKFNFLHNGASSFVFLAAQIGIVSNPLAVYSILDNIQVDLNNVGYVFYYDDRTVIGNNQITSAVGNGALAGNVSLTQSFNYLTPNTFRLLTNILYNTASTLTDRNFILNNNGSQLNNNVNNGNVSNNNSTYNLHLGRFANASSGTLEGYVSELIMYQSDKTNDRTPISNNINSYYGIY